MPREDGPRILCPGACDNRRRAYRAAWNRRGPPLRRHRSPGLHPVCGERRRRRRGRPARHAADPAPRSLPRPHRCRDCARRLGIDAGGNQGARQPAIQGGPSPDRAAIPGRMPGGRTRSSSSAAPSRRWERSTCRRFRGRRSTSAISQGGLPSTPFLRPRLRCSISARSMPLSSRRLKRPSGVSSNGAFWIFLPQPAWRLRWRRSATGPRVRSTRTRHCYTLSGLLIAT